MTRRYSRVGLLMGGSSPEREVSLMSAAEVGPGLRRAGYEVVEIDPGDRPVCEVRDAGVEAVFIILHGADGENGVVQGVLKDSGIPFTGSDHYACAVCMDKHYAKLIWRALGLPTPPHRLLGSADPGALDAAAREIGFPAFVKPRRGGSSVASARADDMAGLREAVEAALGQRDDALVEPCVAGDEVTVGILGRRALPSIRIVPAGGVYDYEAKYVSDETVFVCPGDMGEETEAELRELSLRAFDALGCSGWGRVDLILQDGRPHLLEVNTVPGMTSHSLVPAAARTAGIGFERLVGTIMEDAEVTR